MTRSLNAHQRTCRITRKVVSRASVTFSLLGLSVVLSGCLERIENLEVQPNGGLAAQLEYHASDPEEIDTGDAMPKMTEGWIGERSEKVNEDGNIEVTLTAANAFPPKYHLPENYADKSDSQATCYLQFPTKVKVEKRGKAIYYHFARTYGSRDFAKIDFYNQTLVTDPLQQLGSLDPKDWTPENRVMVVKALAQFETAKDLLFAREAFKSVTPEGRQDGWLAAWKAGNDFANSQDYAALSAMLEPVAQKNDADDRDDSMGKEIKAQAEKFESALLDVVRTALRDTARYDGGQLSAFDAEYALRKLAWEVTQDLNDEKFRITVKMPGVIVGSNADSTTSDTATWEFDGSMLHDREIELLVTSVLTK
ncbi:MAG TPA: hypothetical protein VG711_08290 [Phycisphaerales bacterium]|nr:hypothetical protein [Phycisphaerales bacterium]